MQKRFSQSAIVLMVFLGACTTGVVTDGDISDPIEPANRAIHQVNKGIDTVILRPVSQVYGAITPDPVERSIGNATANLGVPGDAINQILQGDLVAALRSVGRFGVNTTIGLAGLFDPASELGLVAETTDFGQTLHIWGLGEGAYVEMPLFGPSTSRDAVGTVVDIVLDPLNALVPAPESDYILGANALGVVNQRKQLGEVIDTLLYRSADSYAVARRSYLDNRRKELRGDELDADDFDDPFAFEP